MKLPPQAWYVLGGFVLLGLIYWKGKGAVTAAANAVNPVNHDNVFASGVNGVGTAVTGDDDFSLGARIYDWTHPSNPFTK